MIVSAATPRGYNSLAMVNQMRNIPVRLALLCCLVGQDPMPTASGVPIPGSYGIASRVVPRAYLGMPHRADGKLPLLLSQTGAFKDVRNLVHADGLIPYDLIVPFWSDGAVKDRWVAVPAGKIQFSPSGEWKFPQGTVFVKTFELSTNSSDPSVRRRLETRFLVTDEAGGVYGVVYKWRLDNSDADLLRAGESEQVPIRTASGETRSQTWYYPSRQDCLTCHNARAGGVLGVKTRQLNHAFSYPSRVVDNELRTWNHLGLFSTPIDDTDLSSFVTLAASKDTSRSVDDRARSYLDANCSHCHQPGGTVANFDARFDTPLEQQALVDGSVLIDQGIDKPRIIAPHDPWRSIAYMRVNTVGDIRMPPLARNTVDAAGVNLINEWIMSMPGRPVLTPPAIAPAGGNFDAPIEVTLAESEPGAQIRYTLDGSVPGPSDLLYDKPIKLTGPTVLRTRAYKDGFTRSIIAQEVFIAGKSP
jgi:uncharacterized repeat protein (TIGR03806 family)